MAVAGLADAEGLTCYPDADSLLFVQILCYLLSVEGKANYDLQVTVKLQLSDSCQPAFLKAGPFHSQLWELWNTKKTMVLL